MTNWSEYPQESTFGTEISTRGFEHKIYIYDDRGRFYLLWQSPPSSICIMHSNDIFIIVMKLKLNEVIVTISLFCFWFFTIVNRIVNFRSLEHHQIVKQSYNNVLNNSILSFIIYTWVMLFNKLLYSLPHYLNYMIII